ncbi:MAG: hypothetical protein AAB397_02260 [Patescibacteria group bacterium]
MIEKLTLLGKTFGVYCSTHPNEYHDTLIIDELNGEAPNKNAMIYLDIRFDTNEWDYYSWEIPIISLLEFEKKLNRTGTAIIEEENNLLAMKIEGGKLFYKIKIANKLFKGKFISNNWSEIKEK